MRYTGITGLEATFLRTGNNGEYGLQRLAIPVPGEPLLLEGFLCTPKARAGYYYGVAHPKQRIVIHYTAGSLRPDIETLTTGNRHVSVPFVIARDGTIYQLFSSRFWSGNLGKGIGNTNTNNAQDKCTIAIEISNYGFLTARDGNLETCYSRLKNKAGVPGPVDVYCSLVETDAYEKLSTPFRQQSYFATYSKAQYQSLIILLRYLTATYNIPRQFMPEPMRYQATNDVLHFKGIVSHVNYRSDGKWDIGPAFDWNNVITGVQSASFNPDVFRGATIENMRSPETPITSEQEIDALLPEPEDSALENEPYEEINKLRDETDIDMGFLKSLAKPAKKKLYALLVGVDEYNGKILLNGEVVFPQLSGCVPDSKRMKTYLENDPAFDTDIKLITNKEATKEEIVRLFGEHLGQAQKDDTALFFFSGHGTQEWADTSVWKEETDGKLECIVCYYDNASDDKLLADKELRFLLRELAQNGAHVIAMFDCCHSADNTRNGAIVKKEFSEAIEKRVAYAFPKREWESFVFSNEIKRADMKQKGEAALLPEGKHIQLSACESNESALEVSGSGVFTKALLQVLKAAGGDVSYQSLGGRVRQYLKNVYEQKPRIYIAGNDQNLLNANFLDRPSVGGKQAFGELVYNEETGWKFTLGAIHGITEETKNITITDGETDEKYEGEIGAIEIDCCFVTTVAKLKKTKTYNGVVNGFLSNNLKVFVQGDGNALKETKQLMNLLFEDARHYIVAEDAEGNADYVVRLQNGLYYITRPADEFRPVAAAQPIKNKNAANVIAAQLIHISQWEFLRNLKNHGDNKLPEDALKTELSVGKDSDSLLDETATAIINYNKVGGIWEATMTLKLTNTAAVDIYCCALYLSSDFGSDAGFLNPPVYLLEPENTVKLSFEKNDLLPLELSDVVRFYNQKEEVEYFKIIVSTEPFDVQALLLGALPKPPVPGDNANQGAKEISITRGIRKQRSLNGWTTKTITLRLQNPLFDKLTAADKKSMYDDLRTEVFAHGLYPDVKREPEQSKGFSADNIIKPAYRDGSGIKTATKMRRVGEPKNAMPPPSAPHQEQVKAGAEAPDAPFDFGDVFTVSGRGTTVVKPQTAPAPAPSKSHEGQLEYDIPGQMQTGKKYTCKVHIAGNEVAASLMKIGEDSVHAAIRVTEEMSVQLIDCSGGYFTIVPLSTERQSIDEGEMTKWAFDITPKQSGNHCLVLKITIHLNGKNKDLDILEKDVLVSASNDGAASAVKDEITRILFVSANPLGTSQLRIGAETRQIKEEIGLAKARDKFLFTTNLAVTTRTLSRAILQEDPTIVHFSGHGDEEGLCLETDSGLSKMVDATALGMLFKNFADTIKCVVLNACYSKAQAEAIVKHIPFVIGMNRAVKDEAALAFSVHFYQALTDGTGIGKAFAIGLAGMAMAAPGEENVAVLLEKT